MSKSITIRMCQYWTITEEVFKQYHAPDYTDEEIQKIWDALVRKHTEPIELGDDEIRASEQDLGDNQILAEALGDVMANVEDEGYDDCEECGELFENEPGCPKVCGKCEKEN